MRGTQAPLPHTPAFAVQRMDGAGSPEQQGLLVCAVLAGISPDTSVALRRLRGSHGHQRAPRPLGVSRALGSRQAGSAPARLSELELQAASPPALRSGLAAALVLEQGRSQKASHEYACPS